MKKYRKAFGAALIIFTILASSVTLSYFLTSTNVGYMAVSRIKILNLRFIIGNDTHSDQLKVAIQNLESYSITISNGSINKIFATSLNPEPALIEEGYSAFVTLTFTPHTFVDGIQYDVELYATVGIPIGSRWTFDAEYSAQHDYDMILPAPLHETLRAAQLIVASSIITTLGVAFGSFAYSLFDRVRKRALSIRELATLIGINSNISLLIPIIGKDLYDYNYTWVPNLSPFLVIVSLVFLGYGIFHLIGLDIEAEKRRAKIYAILLLIATLFAIVVFFSVMTKFATI